MKAHSVFVIFATALAISMCDGESHFQKCADSIKNDRPLLCKISNLEVDGNMPNVKEFMNCAFEAAGWTDKGGKSFNVRKLVEDMRAYGYNKQNELDEVVKECQTEFGAYISAIDYLACLLIDEKTTKEFKMILMVKEADFFKQNLCA